MRQPECFVMAVLTSKPATVYSVLLRVLTITTGQEFTRYTTVLRGQDKLNVPEMLLIATVYIIDVIGFSLRPDEHTTVTHVFRQDAHFF